MPDYEVYPTRPTQYTYLETFSEDTPENIGLFNQAFLPFIKEGSFDGENAVAYMDVDPTITLPTLTAKVYDQPFDTSSFTITPTGTGATYGIIVGPGSVFINNIYFQITEETTLTFLTSGSYINDTVTMTLTPNSTQYIGVCLHDHSSYGDGLARMGLVSDTEFDSNNMVMLWIIEAEIDSNGHVESVTPLEDAISGFSSILSTPYWGNFVVDGGLWE